MFHCAFTYCPSPVGLLLLAGDERGLALIGFPKGAKMCQAKPQWRRDDRLFRPAIDELNRYFAGELRDFTVTLQLEGTEFQKTVWQTLRTIPFGATTSYGELAHRLGRPKASRAVGAANGANPLPIILPCHRVIGSDGGLTGFGGGIEAKRFLLDHERGIAGTQLSLL